jgi:hypothetical protein
MIRIRIGIETSISNDKWMFSIGLQSTHGGCGPIPIEYIQKPQTTANRLCGKEYLKAGDKSPTCPGQNGVAPAPKYLDQFNSRL